LCDAGGSTATTRSTPGTNIVAYAAITRLAAADDAPLPHTLLAISGPQRLEHCRHVIHAALIDGAAEQSVRTLDVIGR